MLERDIEVGKNTVVSNQSPRSSLLKKFGNSLVKKAAPFTARQRPSPSQFGGPIELLDADVFDSMPLSLSKT